jgi:hypothetical protein
MPLSPEWAKLPKRHCDNCGTLYKQVRPRREGEHGFCTDNCRKSFHKHQGAYSKLKVEMQKMVTREIQKIRLELFRSLSPLADKLEAHITEERATPTIGEATNKARREFAEAISQSLSPCR